MMSSNWHEFLINKGATLSDGSVASFGNAASELDTAANGNAIADLSHLDRLIISGEDAEAFLLSQLSNDIRQLDESRAQLSTYCNPKGRTLGLFLIFREQDNFILVSDPTIATSLMPRLKMFVMRSKVAIADCSGQRVLTGISGPDAETKLSSMFDHAMPGEPYTMWQQNGLAVIRLRGEAPRFMVSADVEKAMSIWNGIGEEFMPVNRSAWEWTDITSGIPSIFPATSERFIPQMLNLDVLGAINFKKGCYPGQEIIARMKYLGKLKQRMYLGHVSGMAPAPGDPVFSAAFGDQSAGTVVNAQPAPDGGGDLLVVAQLKAATEGKLHLLSLEGPPIELQHLPYEIPAEGKTEAQDK